MAIRKLLFVALVLSLSFTPVFAHWNPDDGHKMHFPQMPDPDGWDVALHPVMLADDFKCSQTGPVTDIHFWISWKDDVVGEILDWHMAIHEDLNGRPGQALWKFQDGKIAMRHEEPSKQGWLWPYGATDADRFIPDNHTKYTQINVTEIEKPFIQKEGTVYWLVIYSYNTFGPDGDTRVQIGWKTSLDTYGQSAMWAPGPMSASPLGFQPIPSPSSDQIDLAFVINRVDQPQRPMDFGDADETKSNSYPTTLLRNGARHLIVPGVFMGSPLLTVIQIDPELDGQPTPGCNGDDNNGIDDEQAVVLPSLLVPNTVATVEIMVSTKGYIDAWIDFNGDGDWDDIGEKICNSTPVETGLNALTFSVPATTSDLEQGNRLTSSRFRFSTQGDLNYFGFAPDGEVEDYPVRIGPNPQPLLDYGDAPDGDFAPGGYPTLRIHNGARHTLVRGVRLGRYIDPEIDGQPSNGADGDDLSALDDEDGVSFGGPFIPGQETEIKVMATCNGLLYGWIDFNANSSWADNIDQVFIAEPLLAGVNYLKIPVPLLTQTEPFKTYARFRFVTQDTAIAPLSFDGPASDGEVEDYVVEVVPRPLFDFGDAPELRCDNTDLVRCNSYPTTLSRNGARHIVDRSIFLGHPFADCIQIDAELDGQPTMAADGDDLADLDDEQGVNFLSPIVPGMPAKVQVFASVDGFLDAWIDFNHDGDWDDFGEQIFASEPLTMGENGLLFNTPAHPHAIVTNARTYGRFRFSTYGGLNYKGPARNGEVEDYAVKIEEPQKTPDLGDAPDSTNSFNIDMTAYRSVGPLDVVIKANYPTVYRIGSPPYGPIHWNPMLVAHLGSNISREFEADYGFDEDPLNNLIPPLDRANLDKADNGIKMPLNLPHCNWTSFEYIVRVYQPTRRLYVNAWFDWNRDGDWDDTIPATSNDLPCRVKEWAVRNQMLTGLNQGIHSIKSEPFLPWHPKFSQQQMPKIWMRIMISEKPWEPALTDTADAIGYGGSGPEDGYWIGETEDYFFCPTAHLRRSADLNGNRKVDLDDLAILSSQWLTDTEE
ncbi:MAG: hypothetical protein JEZ07_06085 [Phycisphaerae bacterium]|nr:hypothetical protein [Phycisphaerae bacterium]